MPKVNLSLLTNHKQPKKHVLQVDNWPYLVPLDLFLKNQHCLDGTRDGAVEAIWESGYNISTFNLRSNTN